MKQILILSGKGGTGKTNFASTFAILASETAVAADCDVDAADLFLVLKPIKTEENLFYSGFQAEIDTNKCIDCLKCISVCNFNAIIYRDKAVQVVQDECEGCGYCNKVCPVEAVTMKNRLTGKLLQSQTEFGFDLIHAELEPGGENSGKLVSIVKKTALQRAKELKRDMIIIDGSPGIGCPVSASLAGVNYVVIITEPTLSALSDFKRLNELLKKLHLKAGCIINKCDFNMDITEKIKKYIVDNNIDFIDEYKFDTAFLEANRLGIPIIKFAENQLKEKFLLSWKKILKIISN